MTEDTFLASVRDDATTELSRLGSSKSLYAATRGEMDADAVLAAAADDFGAAADRYEAFADAEAHADAADAFADAAAESSRHHETAVSALHEYDRGDDPAVYDALADLDGTLERLGGAVGQTAVADETTDQVTGFFVGQADPQTADTFRDVGADVEDRLERLVDLLDTVCEDDADWETARTAAVDAIEAAYEEYVETLESLGVNPKPVC